MVLLRSPGAVYRPLSLPAAGRRGKVTAGAWECPPPRRGLPDTPPASPHHDAQRPPSPPDSLPHPPLAALVQINPIPSQSEEMPVGFLLVGQVVAHRESSWNSTLALYGSLRASTSMLLPLACSGDM